MLRRWADDLYAWLRVHRDGLVETKGGRKKRGMKGVGDYINTISRGRVMMTMCSLPASPPSGLLVCAGLRYSQKETETES